MRGKDFLTLLEKKNAPPHYPNSLTKSLSHFQVLLCFFTEKKLEQIIWRIQCWEGFCWCWYQVRTLKIKCSKKLIWEFDLNSHEDAALNFSKEKKRMEHKYFLYIFYLCKNTDRQHYFMKVLLISSLISAPNFLRLWFFLENLLRKEF